MRIKTILLTAALAFGFSQVYAKCETAQDVLDYASKIEVFDETAQADLKAEIAQLPLGERIKLAKDVYKKAKDAKDSGQTQIDKVVLYVLAVVLPPLAVGLHTNWEMPTVWNILWTFLGWLPGVIHAFIVIGR
jgi:uncharacterized membrane protein YqaE (UPF0057 family)